MAKKKSMNGKLLDAWIPPDNSGEPVGCLATTFTFHSDFFEEECLGRFLGLETDAHTDGPIHLIEREEKLSGIMCAAVIVDQHNCRGIRSLRWDLLSARISKGILHSKVTLLCWSKHIRVVIGSANLTEQGYRVNQEIYTILDFSGSGDSHISLLEGAIEFMEYVAGFTESATQETSPALKRVQDFLLKARAISRPWESAVMSKYAKVVPVFTGPDKPDAFTTILTNFPGGPPSFASVVSPFFDPPGAPNKPAIGLWKQMKQRGEAEVCYAVTAEDIEGEDALFINAPETLVKAQPAGRASVSTYFERVNTRLRSENDKLHSRPLHLKTLWLENAEWVSQMIGSSNFTSAGLGLSGYPNIEANILYIVHKQREKKLLKALAAAHPETESIDARSELKWKPAEDDGQDSPSDCAVLPAAFGPAVYSVDDTKKGYIEFTLNSTPPAGWAIRFSAEDSSIYNETEWARKGSSLGINRVYWKREELPSGFEVSWEGLEGTAWLPVQIEDASTLMPPEQLRDLPLDILIQVLTSARPLHLILRSWMKQQEGRGGAAITDIMDPHKRVNTTTFLLQRTRRISWALDAMRKRLEAPVATRESLAWRLYGPVGVIAVKKAIVKEAKSEEEGLFLLAELVLELGRVAPISTPGTLNTSEVRKEIRKVMQEIRKNVAVSQISTTSLQDYVTSAFQEAGA